MVKSPFIPTALVNFGLYQLCIYAWRYLSHANSVQTPSTLEERELGIRSVNHEDSEKAAGFVVWVGFFFQ